MEWSLQHGRPSGSAWVQWVLGVLLTWAAVQAYAGSSDRPTINGPTIAIGDWHTCAIQNDGHLKCWGLPTSGIDAIEEGYFVSVVSGTGFSCALRSDGEAVCVDPANRVPPPPPGPWRSLAAGFKEACGLRPDGRLQCWGRSDGVGATAPAGKFIALSMSRAAACAIRIDGTLQCWSSEEFVDLSDVPPGRFFSVSVMAAHACALRTDGRIFCWGDDFAGPAPKESDFIAVSAGDLYNCALRADASVACWGIPPYGGLNTPQGHFSQISHGQGRTCAVGFDGKAECWGNGMEQWLMNQDGVGLVDVAVGGGETCALDAEFGHQYRWYP